MKKALALIAALVLAAVAAPTASGGPSPGGLSTDNVEWIRHIPIAVDGVGGRLVGRFFYVNDQHKMMIFDTEVPEDPQLVGTLPLPQQPIFGREDLDTNGKILLLPDNGIPTRNLLHIVDVEDKSNPTIIASVAGAAQHTVSCILDCSWAYGSDGVIVDLRDPASPKLMQEKWGDGMPAAGGHDVNEIRPGIILTSSQPLLLLDARKDPLHPKLLATGSNIDARFIHSNAWPRKGKDDFILVGGETNFRVRCNETGGSFMTWDARNWKRTHSFTMIDEYRMQNGTYSDGSPAVNAVGCSAHWLENHPSFHNGGLLAAAFFEHGTRFIDISSKGKIKEIGYHMPWGGSTGAVYWVTNRILYAVDYTRGIDVLKFTGKL